MDSPREIKLNEEEKFLKMIIEKDGMWKAEEIYISTYYS